MIHAPGGPVPSVLTVRPRRANAREWRGGRTGRTTHRGAARLACRRIDAVHGGDNSAAHRVQLDDGRVVFAKTHVDPPDGWFTTEATGLEWLRVANAVRLPAVLAVDDGDDDVPAHLVMEWIEEGGRGGGDEAAFGRALADLHRAGAPAFGREDRRTTGSRRLPNDPCATWPEFYATRRLLPLADLAAQAEALAPPDIDRLRQHRRSARPLRGCRRTAGTPARRSVGRQPARRHARRELARRPGRARRPPRVRPRHHAACSAGSREACFDAYGEVFPLAPGWPDRVELHQISTLVVHADQVRRRLPARRGERHRPLRLSDLGVVVDEPLSEREAARGARRRSRAPRTCTRARRGSGRSRSPRRRSSRPSSRRRTLPGRSRRRSAGSPGARVTAEVAGAPARACRRRGWRCPRRPSPPRRAGRCARTGRRCSSPRRCGRGGTCASRRARCRRRPGTTCGRGPRAGAARPAGWPSRSNRCDR